MRVFLCSIYLVCHIDIDYIKILLIFSNFLDVFCMSSSLCPGDRCSRETFYKNLGKIAHGLMSHSVWSS